MQTSIIENASAASDEDECNEEEYCNLDDCSICLAHSSKHQVTLDKCGHSFHYDCLKSWITEKKRPTCPLCRKDICIVDQFRTGVFDIPIDAPDEQWKHHGIYDLRLGWYARHGLVEHVAKFIQFKHPVTVNPNADEFYDNESDASDNPGLDYFFSDDYEHEWLEFGYCDKPSDIVILTPVLEAVGGGHVEVLRLLLQAGAVVEEEAFMQACYGKTEMLRLFLDAPPQKGNKLNDIERNERIHETPLYNAVCDGNLETVGLLLDRGADMETECIPCEDYRSALGAAAYGFGHPEEKIHVFNLLLARGANPGYTDKFGHTILTSACCVDDYWIHKRLRKIPDGTKREELLTAIIDAKVSMVKMLLADPRVDRDAVDTYKFPIKEAKPLNKTARDIVVANLEEARAKSHLTIRIHQAILDCFSPTETEDITHVTRKQKI